jgi:hypothetical protein
MIEVLYWNTAGSSAPSALILEASREYDVLAISEPWRNRDTGKVHCSSLGRYISVDHGGRAVIYVHKRHPPHTWKHEGGSDWCAVTLQGAGGLRASRTGCRRMALPCNPCMYVRDHTWTRQDMQRGWEFLGRNVECRKLSWIEIDCPFPFLQYNPPIGALVDIYIGLACAI